MQAAVIVAIALVCSVMVVLAAAEGLQDVAGYALLGLVLASGALAVAALRRMNSGDVVPLSCRSCGGLNSAQAPYCKHCGVPLDHSIEA
jgi:ribosomal protein L40E